MDKHDVLLSHAFQEENSNTSANPEFDSVLAARLSRRSLLRGSVGGAATVMFGSTLLSACGDSNNNDSTPVTPPVTEKLLAFTAVPKSLEDKVSVPAGYSFSVIFALGDPMRAATADYKNDGTDTDFENRAGDHHDGMEWFGLASDNKPSATSADRGLLAINFEATTNEFVGTGSPSHFIHATGGTAGLPRPAAEVDKETAIHGIGVIEVKKASDGKWSYVKDSALNFRLTAQSEVEISGPARGNKLLITKYSPDGLKTRGTINNCGTGKTPWGSFVSGEENWNGYFARAASDDTARGNDKSVTALKRYGMGAGLASRHGWETGGSEDRFVRWNTSKLGASADGSDDYRNEANGQGYIIEVDPYDKSRKARKRTALGRFAHESAAFSLPVAGKPLAVYMGDDARNEYIYKFVSEAAWDNADANPADRLATGSKYLDKGKLYAAKFNADGSGEWLELSKNNPTIALYDKYAFADEADVVVNARIAADAVGATKMDRPEWCSVNPKNGEIYYTLTNNSNRRVDPASSSQLRPDSANPRVYTDMKGTSAQNGNPNGHILRIKEGANGSTSTTFTWDVYVFGAEASADTGKVNLSSLTNDQDMSSPDGLAFSKATGICWIQTDDGAYTDVTNCMMLAAVPGQVGDGGKKTLSYTKADGSTLNVDTYIGKAPTADTLKRFLVGPKGSEITGIAETPDGKTLFINIQHPGEETARANVADPTKYQSQWPSNAGYGAGKRPRSATIVITKNDGGRIGS